MPANTSNMGLPYPLGSEKPFIAQAIQYLAQAVDTAAAKSQHTHGQADIPAKVSAAVSADQLSAVYQGTITGAVTGSFTGLANAAASIQTTLPANHDAANHTNLVRKDNAVGTTDIMFGGLAVQGTTFARREGGTNKDVVFENPSGGRNWNVSSSRVRNTYATTTSAGSTSLTATRESTVAGGVVTLSFGGSLDYTSVVVNFTTAFTSTPIVVACCSNNDAGTVLSAYNVVVTERALGSFRIFARRIDGVSPSNGTTVQCQWIAIGPQ